MKIITTAKGNHYVYNEKEDKYYFIDYVSWWVTKEDVEKMLKEETRELESYSTDGKIRSTWMRETQRRRVDTLKDMLDMISWF